MEKIRVVGINTVRGLYLKNVQWEKGVGVSFMPKPSLASYIGGEREGSSLPD